MAYNLPNAKREDCFLKPFKILIPFALVFALLFGTPVFATEQGSIYPPAFEAFEEWMESTPAATLTGDLGCKAALLMEASTGRVLYKSNETEHLPIASVTKIMSTLLVAEAIDGGKITENDMVTVSAYAASMGGSQVFLEAGEQMSVDELLKCLIVVSANDDAVALAEHIYGSADSFIAAMNSRADELGMENTEFVNTTGLDDGGYSSALDVALMTRELLTHPLIFKYTTIWMDTIRNGAFGLSNTNRLVRFYKGANGMKTGFTTEAMYCVSATAERDGMQLIAVVLGSPTSDKRFGAAKQMLDFGFANYAVKVPELPVLEELAVKGGREKSVALAATSPSLLTEKGTGEIKAAVELPENLTAPVKEGEKVGEIIYSLGEKELCRVDITAAKEVKTVSFSFVLGLVWKKILSFV